MTDEKNPDQDDVLEIDPLTGSKTVAQQPTDDNEIHELPETEDEDGNVSRAGDFDETTGAAHPDESAE